MNGIKLVPVLHRALCIKRTWVKQCLEKPAALLLWLRPRSPAAARQARAGSSPASGCVDGRCNYYGRGGNAGSDPTASSRERCPSPSIWASLCAAPACHLCPGCLPQRCPRAKGSDKVRMAGAVPPAPGEAGGCSEPGCFPIAGGGERILCRCCGRVYYYRCYFGCFQKLQQYIHKYLITTFNK